MTLSWQEAKIALLESRPVVKAKAVSRLRKEVADLRREAVPRGSLSGALCKHIRRSVVAHIPPAKLEFFALQMPSQPWRVLADLLHYPAERIYELAAAGVV